MSIVLGDNRYGKAETRLVRLTREEGGDRLEDLNVSIALRGDFSAVHLEGDNSAVLPTDSQKNTVYAFAAEGPVGPPEEFGMRLGRHFVEGCAAVRQARVTIESYSWTCIEVEGSAHPHAFARSGAETRLAQVTVEAGGSWVVAGLDDLVVLKSAGSEFKGFARDRYTTLSESGDRILATAVTVRWRYEAPEADWDAAFTAVRRRLLETFASQHSRSLQQTLFAMGRAALEERPEIAEMRLSLPNRHHFAVDLEPLGLENRGEVFFAADRPYGLIEGTVVREGAPPPGPAW